MDRIDRLFEDSKRNMPQCTLTAQDILEGKESKVPRKKIWIPFVAVPIVAALVCGIVLPFTWIPEETDSSLIAFPTGSFGNSGPIAIEQTWYIGLKTDSLPESEKKVFVYYGFAGAGNNADNVDQPYYELDSEQKVLLSIRREIFEKEESGDVLLSFKTIASFDSTLGEAMTTRTFACTPYVIAEDGSYGFGRFAQDPIEDTLLPDDFQDSKSGFISYTFGIQPKEGEKLHYHDKSWDDQEEYESLGFYYETTLLYEIDKENRIVLQVVENTPKPGVSY